MNSICSILHLYRHRVSLVAQSCQSLVNRLPDKGRVILQKQNQTDQVELDVVRAILA